MKRISALFLVVLLTFSLVACGNSKTEENTGVPDAFQKLSYDDFNNLAMEKGFSPVENTDNSQLEFKRSFTISNDGDFNLTFYEVANTSMAYTYFNFVMQTYESYSSEFSSLQKYKDYGCYVMKDNNVTLYIAFVENTLMYSLMISDDSASNKQSREELIKFVDFVDYPMLDFPEFKN